MNLNNELKGVELNFISKPAANVLNNLKESGFRWHNTKKVWYARQNDKTITLAKQLTESDIKDIEQEQKTKEDTEIKKIMTKMDNKILPLFDRVQFTDAENANLNKSLHGKEIAKLVREHIKNRFPECKFSVTSDYNSVTIELKSSPYDNKKLEYSRDIEPREYRKFEEENNKEITAIIDYCEKYLKSYQYCTCYDPYGDYGSSSNIYTHVSIYDYTQIEQTEAIKKEIENFRQSLEEQKKAEAEEMNKRVEESIKQREIDDAQAKIRAEQDEKDIEIINNNVSFNDLTETDQYMIINAQFAHLNKNNTLDEYKEEVNKGENEKGFYYQDVKITREVYFKTAEALNLFSNMLLSDFDFINGTGGDYTDDPRINSMIDYQNMSKEDRATVKFNLYGIAVYFNNELQFAIDAQGYSYARYVGLTTTANKQPVTTCNTYENTEQIEQDKVTASIIENASAEIIISLSLSSDEWQTSVEYETELKNQLKQSNTKLTKTVIQQVEIEELKVYLYRLLTEMESVQEQFTNANIQQGEKITIISIGDMGMVGTSKGIFESATNSSYAQYTDAVKLTFKPDHKRQLYYTHYHNGKCFIVVSGYCDIPESILWETGTSANGVIWRKTKYGSCDRQQIKDIKQYLEQQEIKILVDRSNS